MRFSNVTLFLCSTLFLCVCCDEDPCSYACQEALSGFYFNGTDPDADYYVAQCTNDLRVQSVYLCLREYCTPEEIEAGLAGFESDCETYGGVTMPDYDIIKNISKSDAEQLQHIDVADLGSVEPFGAPVLVDQSLFDLSKHTMDAWEQSVETRAMYSYALMWFWTIVLGIGMVNHLVYWLGIASNIKTPSSMKNAKRLLKKHVTVPALYGRHSAEPLGWCTIPTRIESMTIASFVIINIVICCVSYDLFEGNLYWSDTATQLSRYVADRAGVLAISNLPLVFAFAMRNDVLLWLTGWSFVTFNQFHRWVARVATIEAIIHSVAYSVETFKDGGATEYYEQWAEQYWQFGVVATICMSLLCGFSLYPMRKYLYEIFLIVHIVLAVVTIVGMWYHVEIFDGEYNPYIWPCVAVWVFDRAVRYGRILVLNLFFTKASASYNPDSNLVRLSIPYRSELLKPQPGTYYYIYVLHGLTFWESHPFTLSDWTLPSKADEDIPDSQNSHSSLKFLIRPYDGFTKRFRSTLLSKGSIEEGSNISSAQSIRALIEGPYSISHDLSKYNGLLFIVAGSGITVATAHLRRIAELASSTSTKFRVRNLKLVWVIRKVEMFHDIFQHELRQWLTSMQQNEELTVAIEVFVSGENSSLNSPTSPKSSLEICSSPISSVAGTDDKFIEAALQNLDDKVVEANNFDKPEVKISATKIQPSSPSSIRSMISGFNITLASFRPDVKDVIITHTQNYNASTANDDKNLAIVACGPARLADDARDGVVKALGLGYNWIDFYPESFNW